MIHVTRTSLITVFAALLILTSTIPAAATTPQSSTSTTNDSVSQSQSDPADDEVGWENGYWHNESLDVTYDDGLNDTELEKVVARSLARVEYLRDAEFDGEVSTRVISREQYRENNPMATGGNPEYDAWNNQVWEALLMVGEDQDANEALNTLYNGSVLGYYQNEDIVIVTPGGDNPKLPEATLVHELTHALQDDRYNLSKDKYGGEVQDAQLGTNGLIEGEAKYIEKQFMERCESGEWECNNPSNSQQGSSNANVGMQLTVFQPYSDGPVYIDHLVSEGGWDAVDAAWKNPPQTSTEIIHPGDERAINVSLAGPRNEDWSSISNSSGINGSDSVGEASVYTMFWYQSYKNGADVIPRRNIQNTENKYDTYNYNHPVSAGLAGDTLHPYENPDAPEDGYVWKTVWDTEEDATEFIDAYETVLSAQGATEQGAKSENSTILVVSDGNFADAFIIAQVENTVYIANGPTKEAARGLLPTDPSATNVPGMNGNQSEATPTQESTKTDEDNNGTDHSDPGIPSEDSLIDYALAAIPFGILFLVIAWLALNES